MWKITVVYDYSVIIIGGGASGLFLHSLIPYALLIEKNSICGVKLLLTGNGACNITHDEDAASFVTHYYDKRRFVTPSIYALPPDALRSYFTSLGIDTYSRDDGKVFPVSGRSSDVRDALLGDARNILYETEVKRTMKEGETFRVETTKGAFTSKFLVIATGGMTYPKTGSTGDGYEFASSLGHSIIPPHPALVSLNIGKDTSHIEGVSVEEVTLTVARKKETGPVVFTKHGIGGPAAENISHWITGKEDLTISLLPSFDGFILKRENGKTEAVTALRRITRLPHSLLDFLFSDIGRKNTASLTKEDLSIIEERLTKLRVTASTDGVKRAMVTTGGVDTASVDSKTMESKKAEGLYFTGEVLDVDGECGGYNLTFAFASAFLAAEDIKRKI